MNTQPEPTDKNQKELEDVIRKSQPTTFPDLTEVNEALKRLAEANVNHTPRQNGPYIICMSCGYKHTLGYVGTKKQLVGINDDGSWRLEDRF